MNRITRFFMSNSEVDGAGRLRAGVGGAAWLSIFGWIAAHRVLQGGPVVAAGAQACKGTAASTGSPICGQLVDMHRGASFTLATAPVLSAAEGAQEALGGKPEVEALKHHGAPSVAMLAFAP